MNVDEFAALIKDRLNALRDVKVVGEIGRVTRASSGHAYFDLKSVHSTISCVAWKSAQVDVDVGQAEVNVSYVDFYPPYGRAQAVIREVQQIRDATADIAHRRGVLIEALQREGVLDRTRLRIPEIVSHVVIITSIGSAACHDMLEGIRTRWPTLRTTVIHSLVQGPHAPTQLAEAFATAHTLNPDVVVCGRGGGSESDLETFNDERVVRSFCSTHFPVVSAVGHETDHTVADIVADFRAKTPTAAIEMILPQSRFERLEVLDRCMDRLQSAMKRVLSHLRQRDVTDARHKLTLLAKNKLQSSAERVQRIKLTMPRFSLKEHMSRLALVTEHVLYKETQRHTQLARCVRLNRVFDRMEAHATILSCNLEASSVKHTLKRGFAIVTTPEKKTIKRARQVQSGDMLRIRLQDGIWLVQAKNLLND